MRKFAASGGILPILSSVRKGLITLCVTHMCNIYTYIYIYISVNTQIDFKTLLNVPLSFKLLLCMIYEVFSGGKIFW